MLSPAGQEEFAKKGFRPVIDGRRRRRGRGRQRPGEPVPGPARLFTIAEDLGGWDAVERQVLRREAPASCRRSRRPPASRSDRRRPARRHRRAATGAPGRRRRADAPRSLTPGVGLGLGIALLWFSLLVLIPLTAVLVQASSGGWSAYWRPLTSEQTAGRAPADRRPRRCWSRVVNIVMGTTIAWVLVRDRFRGKRILEVVIDIPFALPTIVAGLVLLEPVRPVQPARASTGPTPDGGLPRLLVRHAAVRRPDGAAGAAGARAGGRGGGRIAGRQPVHHLPADHPARAGARRSPAGAALSFARAISEYGSLVLLSGNLPYSTEVASVRILSYVEGDKLTDAAAVASILLVVALVVIVGARRHLPTGGPPWLSSPRPYGKVTHHPAAVPGPLAAAGCIVVGYLFLLVIWPVALVAKATFADGLGAGARRPEPAGRRLRLPAHAGRWPSGPW